MKCSLNVAMARLAALTRWLCGGTSCILSSCVLYDCLGALIVHNVEMNQVAVRGEFVVDACEGVDHGGVSV
jgi:hypothetical protein